MDNFVTSHFISRRVIRGNGGTSIKPEMDHDFWGTPFYNEHVENIHRDCIILQNVYWKTYAYNCTVSRFLKFIFETSIEGAKQNLAFLAYVARAAFHGKVILNILHTKRKHLLTIFSFECHGPLFGIWAFKNRRQLSIFDPLLRSRHFFLSSTLCVPPPFQQFYLLSMLFKISSRTIAGRSDNVCWRQITALSCE